MERDNLTAWKALGMDVATHDGLLQVVGTMFGGIYLSQNNRPKRMDYFDIFMSDLHGKRTLELMAAQDAGRKVVGTFCVFVPEELVIAANAIQVGLCAGAEVAYEAAEHYVPRNTCALIKSAFGFKLAKVCPFIEVSDLIVGENTCDGKKKAFEEYRSLVKNFYVLDLPQMKTAEGKTLLQSEYEKFKTCLEELTGRTITPADIERGINIVNAKRAAQARLNALRSANPAPISGLDTMLVNQIGFLDDPERYTVAVNALCDELEQRVKEGEGVAPTTAPRVIISGCPMALPNWKLPNLIEKAGAIIVGEESCVGERGSRHMVEGNTLEAIVERYFQIDCAVFTPNPSRLEHIQKMFASYNAAGVIHYSLQCCQPYTHEAISYERELEAKSIPTLSLETDYSQEDMGQLQTRLEAFFERIAE